MRQRDELELLHRRQDKVVLDRDEVIVAEQHNALLLQIPVVHSEQKKNKNKKNKKRERERERIVEMVPW